MSNSSLIDSPIDQFDQDLDKLKQDVQKYKDAQGLKAQAKKAYYDRYKELLKELGETKNLDHVWVMFAYLLLQQGDGDNTEKKGNGIWNSQIHSDTSIMLIQGDLQALGNDIAKKGNQSGDNTHGDGPKSLDIQAKDMTKLLKLLDSNVDDAEGKLIREAIGENTSSSIFGYMKTKRQDIYDAYDEDGLKYHYNIDPSARVDAPADPKAKRAYHFDVDGDHEPAPGEPSESSTVPFNNGRDKGKGYIGTFKVESDAMSTGGDYYQATEAAKLQTDDSNLFNQSLEATSSYSQEIVQTHTKIQQGLESFATTMLQSAVTMENTIQANIGRSGQ